MTPAETYAACLDAVQAQNARIYGPSPTGDAWGGAAARQFRFDPHREPDRNLAVIASYVQSDDVVVDVGGGAGRVCLPLALRCKEVLNIEPSPGMVAEFESLAQEAGISNARLVPASLAEAQSPRGDIAFTADVTYFVRDINTFIRQLAAAASRRVLITIWTEPPPTRASTPVPPSTRPAPHPFASAGRSLARASSAVWPGQGWARRTHDASGSRACPERSRMGLLADTDLTHCLADSLAVGNG